MNGIRGNVIVGQSGGPTAVINASLAGVYKTAKDMGADTIYGMRYGIQGLLEKKIVDLGEKIRNDMDVELLKRTPASFLGSCRYKLPDIHENPDIYEKIFSILDKLDIEVEIIKVKGPIGVGKALASVNGKKAVSAEITFAIK